MGHEGSHPAASLGPHPARPAQTMEVVGSRVWKVKEDNVCDLRVCYKGKQNKILERGEREAYIHTWVRSMPLDAMSVQIRTRQLPLVNSFKRAARSCEHIKSDCSYLSIR